MTNRNRWTNSFLDSKRQVGDPLADQAIEYVFKHGKLAEVNTVLGKLIRNTEAPPTTLPPALKTYFEESARLPEADGHSIQIGNALFRKYGLIAFTLLACASLPECYADQHGVPVLALTQKLTEHIKRRISETVQMVVRVMEEGGLDPHGRGIRAAQKVRLMHAAVRYLILHPPNNTASPAANFADVLLQHEWDASLGIPLNQEDLAYTLLTFSYVILRGLESLHLPLTPADKEAYIYSWNRIGRVMGIEEGLLADNYADAEYLFGLIKERHNGHSPEGVLLMGALLDYMEDAMPLGLKRAPWLMVRYLIGEETAVALNPRPAAMGDDSGFEGTVEDHLEQQMGLLMREVADDPEVAAMMAQHTSSKTRSLFATAPSNAQRLGDLIFRLLVKKIESLPPQWERELFTIPQELKAAWNY